MITKYFLRTLQFSCIVMVVASTAQGESLERVRYNHPGLRVDLGVGLWAWPMPIDWDRDGDFDLVVSCPDVPFNGTYFFENTGDHPKLPLFRTPVRVGAGLDSVQVSYVAGEPRVLTPATEWVDFLGHAFKATRQIYPRPNIHTAGHKIRANEWRYVDYDGDMAVDIVVGVGDWQDYGWDNAFDATGKWTRGPLHGYVYWLRNTNTTDQPTYASPQLVLTDLGPIDVFGMPSPNFADFDGDGDLDLLCGEFLDGFTYFQNVGTRSSPKYVSLGRLQSNGKPIVMHVQMITPTAIDWDRDGDVDLIVGDEDGRVAFIEHTGQVTDGMPQFLPPQYFQQEADLLKFGALVTPFSVDWDQDGDEDLICGNTSGNIGFIENLDGANPPRWAPPRLVTMEGQPIHVQAGPNGSIQGPAEAKWGYTTLNVADWNNDQRLDLIVNSIWGKVEWYAGYAANSIDMHRSQPVRVRWPGIPPKPAWTWWNPEPNSLATQWRTTPVVLDLDRDQLLDLVMLDHEGYLAFFRQIPGAERSNDSLVSLLPGARLFVDTEGRPLRLNDGEAGRSGRRKICFADWDSDGLLDLIVDSANARWYRHLPDPKHPWKFEDRGDLSDHRLAGHSTSPTVIDWDRNGRPDLLIGAEDGHFYLLTNRTDGAAP